jgi:hypothetical protein
MSACGRSRSLANERVSGHVLQSVVAISRAGLLPGPDPTRATILLGVGSVGTRDRHAARATDSQQGQRRPHNVCIMLLAILLAAGMRGNVYSSVLGIFKISF